MATSGNPGSGDGGHPLVEDVRRIRSAICEQMGHDVDRLCDDLIALSREFDERRGVFHLVTKEAAARVMASWGEDAHRQDDPLVDEVRAIRRKLAEGSS